MFGEIADGIMVLNPLGEIARKEWFRTSELRGYVRLHEDEFVVMPNHVHGIVWIVEGDGMVGAQNMVGAQDTVRAQNMVGAQDNIVGAQDNIVGAQDNIVGAQRRCAPTDPSRVPMYSTRAPTEMMVQRTNVAPGSLGAIIRAYKSAVTYAIHALQGSNELPVWQRNFFEHIIRNDEEYRRIQRYIESNPAKWVEDEENPARWV